MTLITASGCRKGRGRFHNPPPRVTLSALRGNPDRHADSSWQRFNRPWMSQKSLGRLLDGWGTPAFVPAFREIIVSLQCGEIEIENR